MNPQNLPADQGQFFFEDLSIGQRFISGTHYVDEQQIIAFATQFDPQPFHIDPEAARATFFGRLVASGWHTAAITMRLLVSSGLSIPGGMIGAAAEATWPQPTYPGDTLQVETEIIELRPLRSRADRGMATVHSETRNQNGEVVQTLSAKLFVPRRTS